MAILIFKPVFKTRIWGSHYFKDTLKYPLDDELYGELWSLSAHNDGLTLIKNGKFKNKSLVEVFSENKELFNTSYDEFPLMIKLLSTSDVLSVQVHPDDAFAKEFENSLGKTECWYFTKCENNSKIIYGHHASTLEEMKNAINSGNCESLLDYKDVKAGDFALIPSRTVHSPGKGLTFLEVQQSSNLTYRLYDYNRKDKDGKLRELHIEKALKVIDFPQKELPLITNYENSDSQFTTLTDCDFFRVIKWKVSNHATYVPQTKVFNIFSVAKGSVVVNDGESDYVINEGESFISTIDSNEIVVRGNGELIISYSKK